MTEDPVKLYVVVMAVLLCVLGYVALSSYQDAAAFEAAIERAPREAKVLKEYASKVSQLCDQLSKSKLRQGEVTLIEQAGNFLGIVSSSVGPDQEKRLGRRGKQQRWHFNFGTGTSKALTRTQVARLCQKVESDSQGVLKTLEIELFRITGKDVPDPGKEDSVTTDVYRGRIVFGKNTVD